MHTIHPKSLLQHCVLNFECSLVFALVKLKIIIIKHHMLFLWYHWRAWLNHNKTIQRITKHWGSQVTNTEVIQSWRKGLCLQRLVVQKVRKEGIVTKTVKFWHSGLRCYTCDNMKKSESYVSLWPRVREKIKPFWHNRLDRISVAFSLSDGGADI